jgi:hypothetical protein
MTIRQTIDALEAALEAEDINENTNVFFRHSITAMGDDFESSADYLLTHRTESGVLICHDDEDF